MFEELLFLFLLNLLLLVLLFFHELVVFNSQVLQLLYLSSPYLFSLFESQVNHLLLFLFSLSLLSLQSVPLVKFILVFGYPFKLSPVSSLIFNSLLLLRIILFLHDLIQLLLLFLRLDDSLSFLSNETLDLVIS